VKVPRSAAHPRQQVLGANLRAVQGSARGGAPAKVALLEHSPAARDGPWTRAGRGRCARRAPAACAACRRRCTGWVSCALLQACRAWQGQHGSRARASCAAPTLLPLDGGAGVQAPRDPLRAAPARREPACPAVHPNVVSRLSPGRTYTSPSISRELQEETSARDTCEQDDRIIVAADASALLSGSVKSAPPPPLEGAPSLVWHLPVSLFVHASRARGTWGLRAEGAFLVVNGLWCERS